jgi:hypothetical protein
MKFEPNIVFTPAPGAWQVFTQEPHGEVGSYLRRVGRQLKALAVADVPREHGALAMSINSTYSAVSNPFVKVGSDVDYAYMVHEGTDPHKIFPTKGKVLRFTVKGRVVYASSVNHPGTDAHKYLSDHLREVIK